MLKSLPKIMLVILICIITVQPISAHDGGSQPQPTAEAPASIAPDTEANSSNGTPLETAQETSGELTIDSRLITISVSMMLSLIAVSTTWLIGQGQLPRIAFGIGALISYTAFVHLVVGFSGEMLLIANGLGYLAWLLLRIIPKIRASRFFSWIDFGIIAYTIITFVGYFTLHGHVELVGVTSKVAEALLIIVLAYRILTANSLFGTQPQMQVR